MKRVYLEITNACNLNCSFCTYEKGNLFIPYDKIVDYIRQIKPFCNYVYLHILGEPLLHPDFDRILDLLDRQEMNLQLVTNGTLLKDHPDLLWHSCLRKLSVSLHSISGVEVSSDYFNTIDKLIETERKASLELRFYDPGHLDEKLTEYLNGLKEKYSFTVTSKKNSVQIKNNTYVYLQEFFRWPKIDDPVINDTGTCHGGIDMLGITADSQVTLCCLDPKAHNSLGSLAEMSFAEIISSDAYQKRIQEFKMHRICAPLCKRCAYRLRFK